MSRRGGAAILAALALAALSLLPWPLPPAYDAWAWLGWGRDLAHLELDTDATAIGVAWKPLPALLAAPLALFGGAAPDLWVLVVRCSALLSLLLAYRLGERLSGRLAGVAAAIALAVIPGWWEDVARADAEPLLCAAMLATVELHLGGRRGAALGGLTLAALLRPEVWPFLAAYAILAGRADPRLRLPAALCGGAVLGLWFGVDLLGSGDALTAAGTARQASVETSAGEAFGHALHALALPVWALAIFGLAEARERRTPEQRATLAIGAIAFVWLAEIVVLGDLGYLGSQRFVIGPAALLSVLAGVGAAGVVAIFAPRWRPLAAVVVLLLAVPLGIDRHEAARAQVKDLPGSGAPSPGAAIEAAGGREGLLACRGPIFAAPEHLAELAYRLDAPPGRLTTPPLGIEEVPTPGVLFVAAGDGLLSPLTLREGRVGRFTKLARGRGWLILANGCR